MLRRCQIFLHLIPLQPLGSQPKIPPQANQLPLIPKTFAHLPLLWDIFLDFLRVLSKADPDDITSRMVHSSLLTYVSPPKIRASLRPTAVLGKIVGIHSIIAG